MSTKVGTPHAACCLWNLICQMTVFSSKLNGEHFFVSEMDFDDSLVVVVPFLYPVEIDLC